jgi:hypothetical protein
MSLVGGRRGWPTSLGILPHLLLLLVALLLLVPFNPAISTPQANPPQAAPVLMPPGSASGANGIASSVAIQDALDSLQSGRGPASHLSLQCMSRFGSAACAPPGPPESPGPSSSPGSSGVSRVGVSAAPSGSLLPTYIAPSPRFGAAVSLFLNGTTYGILLFGGANMSSTNRSGGVFSDTWQFNPGDHTWWNVSAQACASFGCPSDRWEAAAAYDYADGYAVLFGGCFNGTNATRTGELCRGLSNSGGALGDTWEYVDPAGGAGHWVPVFTFIRPPPRFDSALAYDGSDGYLVLFGGCGVRCPLGDTWNFSAGRWNRLFTGPSPPLPQARFGEALTPIGRDGGLLLFGGCFSYSVGCLNGRRILGDTWVFTANSWIQFQNLGNCTAVQPCPSPRFDMGATSYTGPGLSGQALIYGGMEAGGHILGSATEPGGGWWTYGGSPLHWSELTAPPGWDASSDGWTGPATPPQVGGNWGQASPPVPRYFPALEGTPYGGLLLFGGAAPNGRSLDDTWAANYLSAPPGFLPYSGLVGPSRTPPAEYALSAVYDARDQYTVLFGGCASSCPNETTWSYVPYSASTRLQPWEPILPTAGEILPAARQGANLIYTPLGGGVVLLFGGEARNGVLLNDLWQFSAGVWTQLNVVGPTPSPRQLASMAYDGADGDVVLFGGQGASQLYGDTWTLNYLPFASSWSWNEVVSKNAPMARYDSSSAFDPLLGRLVLFGGCGATCPLGDTWEFTLGTWTRCVTDSCLKAAPTSRQGASATFDRAAGGTILFGGCGAVTCPFGETWLFNGSGNGTWARVALVGATPQPRYHSTLAFDEGGGYSLLLGGVGAGGVILGGAGWAFQGGGWFPTAAPSGPPPSQSFQGRFGVSLVYDSHLRAVVLFGGCVAAASGGSCSVLHTPRDTWLFSNDTWKLLCTGCGPSPRWDAQMAYDPSMNGSVLFGGCPMISSAQGSCFTPLNDTWLFNRTWIQLRPGPSPPARGDAAVALDPRLGSGGCTMTGACYPGVFIFGGWGGNRSLNDTWVFSQLGWVQVPSTCAVCPPLLTGSSLAFNENDGLMEMYGGYGPAGVSNTLWVLFTPGPGWIQLSTGPIALFDASVTYDPNMRGLVIFGGIGTSGAALSSVEWFASNRWTSAGNAPAFLGGRWGGAMVFDPLAGPDGYDLLVGGASGPGIANSSGVPGGSGTAQGDTFGYLWEGGVWYDLSPFC